MTATNDIGCTPVQEVLIETIEPSIDKLIFLGVLCIDSELYIDQLSLNPQFFEDPSFRMSYLILVMEPFSSS